MKAFNPKTSFRAKKNRAMGEFSQDLVRRRLELMGFKMVERVHTPWTVVRRMGRVVGAFPKEKVSGDFIAVKPLTGQKVLVEVKSRESGVFPWSMMEPHQVVALNENHLCNGISILALVQNVTIEFHPWPIKDFGPGKSITIEKKSGFFT